MWHMFKSNIFRNKIRKWLLYTFMWRAQYSGDFSYRSILFLPLVDFYPFFLPNQNQACKSRALYCLYRKEKAMLIFSCEMFAPTVNPYSSHASFLLEMICKKLWCQYVDMLCSIHVCWCLKMLMSFPPPIYTYMWYFALFNFTLFLLSICIIWSPICPPILYFLSHLNGWNIADTV